MGEFKEGQNSKCFREKKYRDDIRQDIVKDITLTSYSEHNNTSD